VVLSQDDNVELGEGRHFGDLFPLPGVQPVDIHRESVDGEGWQGGGASGALLFITFTFLLTVSCFYQYCFLYVRLDMTIFIDRPHILIHYY
jgi:hypothetical protein